MKSESEFVSIPDTVSHEELVKLVLVYSGLRSRHLLGVLQSATFFNSCRVFGAMLKFCLAGQMSASHS